MRRSYLVPGAVLVLLGLLGHPLAPASRMTPSWASETLAHAPNEPVSGARARHAGTAAPMHPGGKIFGPGLAPASSSPAPREHSSTTGASGAPASRPSGTPPTQASGSVPAASSPALASAVGTSLSLVGEASIARFQYGVDVFSYDQQLNAPSTAPALQKLGIGLQQFPNDNTWSWTTNTFRSGSAGAVSLARWGSILEATGSRGLFIFNYDENPAWTGGGTPADAAAVTRYIVQRHLPIDAIVIGSEEYGSWDYAANLNPSTSAAYYGQQAAAIAAAIHQVDPAMLVGLVMDPGTAPYDVAWNRTVLGAAGGYVNFVSVHEYPIFHSASDAGLLSGLAADITDSLQTLRGQLRADLPTTGPATLPIWITEFNPYYQPGPQATRPVYGAAMVESAILWRALGAARLVVWSYDGQAHRAVPGYPVDTVPHTAYGLFALVGDGIPPELPVNALYPSGIALSTFLHAVAGGGTLTTWETSTLIVGQVSSGAGYHVFAVNMSSRPAALAVGSHSLTVPPAGLVSLATSGPVTPTLPGSHPAPAHPQHSPASPASSKPSPAPPSHASGHPAGPTKPHPTPPHRPDSRP